MDEGDRPGTDDGSAERTDTSDGDGDDRDEAESTDSADASDPTDSADASDPTDSADASDPTDSADASDPTDSIDPTAPSGPVDTTGPVEPAEGSELPGTNVAGEERARTGDDEPSPEEPESLAYRFRHDREGALMWIREMLTSVAIVLVIGLILFGISGVWPPMVAVESGSMEPNMEVGDLVFVTEPGRLAPDAATNDVGVVTYEEGRAADYRTFGSYGSVVIYRPPGRTASPIIHRAMFHVEEGENWYDRADDEYHSAAGCAELRNCPAPHDGFVTLGDNNGAYDQANGLASPVKAEWVTGVARVRVPYLGYVRLIASGQAELSDVLATTVVARSGSLDGTERADGIDAVDEREAVNERETINERETVNEREAVNERRAVTEPTISGGNSIARASA